MAHARIGILGGTLDPVHVGHLEAARIARRALDLEAVLLMPSHVPPHRTQQPVASAFHRFAMAALAARDEPWLLASDLELLAPGPTYTADTLDRLRQHGLRPSQIFFITGADAFAEIETWSRYPDVLDLAHFVVIARSGLRASDLPERLPALAHRMRPPSGATRPSGDVTVHLLDATTPDVSSTGIRERLRRDASLAGLVTPDVDAHIRRHGLYAGGGLVRSTLTTADHLHGQD